MKSSVVALSTLFAPVCALAVSAAACKKEEAPAPAPAVAPTPAAPSAPPTPTAPPPAPTAGLPAPSELVGKPAPDFTLNDLDGAPVNLAALRGKTVVLEWFNPKCPFVVASHTKGSLVDAAKRHTEAGVVWLAINSGGPGKQGHELAHNVEGAKTFGLSHPILRDEDGAVGKAYGATNTPNLFVIDGEGVVRYAGAVDNSPDGEAQSPEGGTLVRYVDAALEDLAAGRPVATPSTKPYGCSVKYAS
ncbi:MAG: redoxin family protein [Kofleriaceae bacterium]